MRILATLALVTMMISLPSVAKQSLRIATYNVSMDASNYLPYKQLPSVTESPVPEQLAKGNPQIAGIAEIIQRVRPDIILLNEFDYMPREKGVQVFLDKYLGQSQNGLQPISYEHIYYSTVNTGKPSPFDLNRDGKATGRGNDAWGFGWYHGQYGMMILSKYPIDEQSVRTFQNFLWKDMPDHHVPKVPDADGNPTDKNWYSDEVMEQFPLASKSAWDVPVNVNGKTIHLVVSHPTPPSFDGPENRNGMKNYDEIRLVHDYLSPEKAGYIYDDNGTKGGLPASESFVIMGDLNAGPGSGGVDGAIEQLLEHPRVHDPKPVSKGGSLHSPDMDGSEYHTAAWRKRIDYVLPSKDLTVKDTGIFWPIKGEPGYRLMSEREASSDHRLVWLDLSL